MIPLDKYETLVTRALRDLQNYPLPASDGDEKEKGPERDAPTLGEDGEKS